MIIAAPAAGIWLIKQKHVKSRTALISSSND